MKVTMSEKWQSCMNSDSLLPFITGYLHTEGLSQCCVVLYCGENIGLLTGKWVKSAVIYLHSRFLTIVEMNGLKLCVLEQISLGNSF